MTMTVNKELLLKTLDYIETHRRKWRQSHYRCKSGCCFAGHAALLAGWKWANPNNDLDDLMVKGDQKLFACLAAVKELGLQDPGAEVLFSHTNKIADLRRIVAELTA